MDTDIEKESLRLISNAKHYNKWVYSLINPYLKSPVLEVGSGIGTITNLILKKFQVLASEYDQDYLKFLKKKYSSNKNFKGAVFIDLTKFTKIGKFDTVVCTNVLHHVKDDKLAINNINKYLKKGGHLILQEPAHQFLFGSLDIAQNHYRRYELKNLSRKLSQHGFKVEKSFYFNFLGFLGWLINSILLRRSTISNSQMLIIDKLIKTTSKVEDQIHLPFGLSVFVIARKVK